MESNDPSGGNATVQLQLRVAMWDLGSVLRAGSWENSASGSSSK